MTNAELAAWMFFQLGVILCVVRAVGYLARYIGQPQVVGEMIAGVLIGPSVLGAVSPELQSWLFPEASLPILYALAQIGLTLYMFLVGLEFDRALFRLHARGAVSISLAGILVPFSLGGLFVWGTFDGGDLFNVGVSLPQAILFTGASMSITAFPMLARIIKERGLSGSTVGVLALAAGAVDDAAAWCILALVLSCFKGDLAIAARAIVGGGIYAAIVFGVVMPWLARRESWIVFRLRRGGALLGVSMAALCFGAWFTDTVGIYSVFGAFVFGIAVPRQRIAPRLRRDIEPIASTLFLPLFFIYSGLNTRMTLLLTPATVVYTIVVIAFACLGKGAACGVAARRAGQTIREATMLGALMNARGLMELLLLMIGLERGIITPTFFAMMVMMAIVTTLMASPVFMALYGGSRSRSLKNDEVDEQQLKMAV